MTTEGSNDGFARLAQRFGERLADHLTAIAETLERCDSGVGSDAVLAGAARDVHRLAGTCGLYGFREHCDRLVEIERRLTASAAAADCAAIAAAVRALAGHPTQ